MPFNPKISIIIPVYNGNRYLNESIDSALSQTYKNIEVIVINDGSNDSGKTEKIAKSYGTKVRYYSKENGGVSSALNMGIQVAGGDYISWLSHDDVYYKDKIEYQINILENINKNIILYSDFDIINEKSELTAQVQIRSPEPEHFRYFLMTDHPIHGCTALIQKETFKKYGLFNESLKTTQDYDMWFRLAKEINFIHIPRSLIKSRHHSEQGIHTMNTVHKTECNDLLIKFLQSLSQEEITKHAESSLGLSYAKIALNFGKRGFLQASKYAAELARKNLYKQPFLGIMSTILLTKKLELLNKIRRL